MKPIIILALSIFVIACASLPNIPGAVSVSASDAGITVCSTFDRAALADAGVK
jgi:hypothetical protein